MKLPIAAFLALALPLAGADLTAHYKATADKLIEAALADSEGYNRLSYLCYRIGNRLSGSPGLEKAIAWSVEQMKAAGLSNVRTIPTHRGAVSLRFFRALRISALRSE